MKKIISITLALFLLAGHLSLALGTHFCGGLVMKSELMVGHQHLDCGMSDMDMEHHDADNVPQFEKVPCCQNEYTSLEIDDEFSVPSSINIFPIQFIAVVVTSFLKFSEVETTPFSEYSDYAPPLPSRDFQVTFQTFLI